MVSRLVARVQRTKMGEGLLRGGDAMSHFRTLKNETGAERNWMAGAKVTRSWRKGWRSKWKGTSGGIFSEGSGSLPVILYSLKARVKGRN